MDLYGLGELGVAFHAWYGMTTGYGFSANFLARTSCSQIDNQ